LPLNRLLMVITPKTRGFVCITAHPEGCAQNVQEQIDFVKQHTPAGASGPKNVLVIGASTGYGLSTRITAAFGYGANTLGIFFERPSDKGRPASAGWYNSVAFEEKAQAAGLWAKSLNGDAFSPEMKQQAIDLIQAEMGKIDLVIYSLAAPRRTDPRTGATHKSCLRTVGQPFTAKSVDTDKGVIEEVTVQPATAEEIEDTRKVMGGEDWALWMEALQEAGVLAEGMSTVAYSYIGPELTYPIYRNGTIGKAKEDLEATASKIDAQLAPLGGKSYVSVNKAVVTQASSAIPVVPLYISLLIKVMTEKGIEEGCIEQIVRLFKDRLYQDGKPETDEAGRIRVDDWEMRPDVQEAVEALWPQVTTDNLREIAAFDTYQQEFLKLFGFGVAGVDYAADTEPARELPSAKASS